jgi:23S rRNA (uracil-5-)-methyltransferase RumA
MEFSFGDEIKDGPLSLGLHKRNSTYDIVTVVHCRLVDADYRKILTCVYHYFLAAGIPFYHKMTHQGFLRHLLVRKAVYTKEILVDLVTTTQLDYDLKPLAQELKNLKLDGTIVGFLHTRNDSVSDTIRNDKTETVSGQDHFYERLLGLTFKITPFSFFQTNSLGAEVLYRTARDYIGTTKDKVIFDLYSGTGTIAQILAPVAKKVIGVEIVEEAVESAKTNARLNNLDNCDFIAGDVLKVIDALTDKPDLIVLDPPRDGIHPKALEKIISFGVDKLVYISCKPTSLVRDLAVFQERGYRVERCVCVDMFPGTGHVETVVLLSHKKPDSHINVKVEFGEGEGKIQLGETANRAGKVTYKRIKTEE